MKKSFIIILFTMLSIGAFSQPKWTSNPNSERAFVENKGQYDGRNWQSNNPIKFALSQQDGWFTFFSKTGVTHRIERLVRNPKKKKDEGDAHKNLPSRIHLSEFVNVSFVGANNNVTIIAEEKTSQYYSYAVKDLKTNDVNNINNVTGYKKITYKNIYNNIDIEYTLHPDGGIKYNVILHPGADPNQIKMKYEAFHTNHLDEKVDIKLNTQTGQLEINTASTKIIEHKPLTFYQNSKTVIQSKYAFNNNILTFDLGNYDNSQKVVIDPWVVTPNFNAGDFTREVETDAAGNVYVIGGEIPMELRKYGIAGNLIWTYITPWDTNGGDWLGTLATDAAGVSYITQGTGAEIERVSTAGAMVWHANAPGLFSITEYWTITFNCDNTKLIVGGTGGSGLNFEAKIYDMDLNNGNVLADVTVGTQGGFTPIEVRSIAPTKNSKYVYLTHTEVGAINQNLTACSSTPDFQIDNTHHLGYKCENYLSSAQNGGGLKALIANDNYYYTHKGDQILQWDINNGTLLNTVNLPGGSSNNGFGGLVVHCSGLDVDATGNVYAGSMDRVVKFDPNLNILSQVNTTGGFTVYDVSVNSNGEVLAVGALLNNSTSTGRGGRIESLNMTAGSQYATVCCDPNFCPVNSLCVTDAPVALNPNTPGGTWSSTPATPGLNTSTGVFDPSVSGTGNFVVTYTLGCGTYSTNIQVGNCTGLTVCLESNGDLTVSGGTATYTWYQGGMQATCVAGLGNCAGLFTFTDPGPSVLTWSSFGTGTTITPPPGVDTIKVVDSFGDSLVILSVSGLPSCNPTACDATITAAGPFCENDAPVTLSAVDPGGTWSGNGITNTTTGIFDPSVAGPGSHVITYSITGSCTDTDTETIVVNAQDDASFNYSPTTFCTTDPNPTPTITGTTGGTFTIDNSGVINASTGEVNISGSGTGIFNVTYTTNGTCPDTATVSINITSGADATITAAGPFCENDASVTLSAVDPGGVWSGTGITNTSTGVFDPSTAVAGTHQIIYTISGSCGDADTISIVVDAQDDASFNYSPTTFCTTDPNPTPTITGTTGGTFTIDNSGVINASTGEVNISGSGTGIFNVTYTTNGTCPDTATVSINITSGADATITAAGPFCENDASVTLSAVDPGGVWSGTGITNTSTGVFDPSTAGAGTHQVIYTISGSCGDADTISIVVDAQDDASFNYSPTTFCTTDPNPTPTITGTTGGTFTIDNSGVINATTGEVNISSSGAGVFNVTYTTNGTCPDTATVSINITSGADATITASGPFCENDASVTLSAVDPGGVWSGTGITNTSTGVFDPSTAGAGTHQVIYTISGSCGDADTISIVVDAQDDASFNYSPTTFCTTDPNPTPTITGTTGGTFTIDNSGVINASTGEVNITGSGAGTFIVTYITNGTCPDTSTVTININNCTLPQPIANFSASQTNICEGDCINFTDLSTSSATGGITAWSWTFTGGIPSTSNQQNPTNVCFATAGTYTISLTVTDANGSDDTTMTAYITVNNCSTPTASFTVSDDEICAGECVDFTDMSTGATSWQWTFNGGIPSTSTDQNPTNICFGTDSTYTIELIASNANGSDTMTSTITVHPTPIVNAGSDVVIKLGETTLLNATGSSGNYSWTPPTWLTCPLCPTTNSSPEETITYTVTMVDSNGCSASDQVTVIVDYDYVIWVPNIFSPNGDGSNDILYVRGKGVADLNFFVYDRWGEKVFETTSLDNGWDGKFRGKDMNKAVFVYYLEATFIDGSKVTKKGDVTLIR